MKKVILLSVIALHILCLTACGSGGEVQPSSSSEAAPPGSQDRNENAEFTESETSEIIFEIASPEPSEITIRNEEGNPMAIEIHVGTKTFSAELFENETASAFANLLPLELNMTELNGNEKYYYLDSSLPADASNPGEIHAGDLMLYGSNCIVLFYDSFSTSYTYTPIGRVLDPEGFAAALGSGNVTVSFKIQ